MRMDIKPTLLITGILDAYSSHVKLRILVVKSNSRLVLRRHSYMPSPVLNNLLLTPFLLLDLHCGPVRRRHHFDRQVVKILQPSYTLFSEDELG